jgi:hypothetical protein
MELHRRIENRTRYQPRRSVSNLRRRGSYSTTTDEAPELCCVTSAGWPVTRTDDAPLAFAFTARAA